jgi:pimeloyl-ACP methyl ester carboxylesterase
MSSISKSSQETPVILNSQSHRLVGMLHPSASTKIVILCHGFTFNKIEHNRIFVETARALAERQYNALRFDFYGSGDSEGDFADTLFSSNIQNIIDVVRWCRQQGYGEIALLGISMGAAAAICSVKDVDIHALVTWSAVPDMKKLFETKIGPLEALNASIDQYEYEGWLIKPAFLHDALKYDIEEELSQITVPKMIVQGTGDDDLFVDGFQRFREIVLPPAYFMEIPQADHAYQKPAHRRQVIKQTLTWLQRNF